MGDDWLLDALDGRLGEAARREHRFAWLLDPRSGQWLAVDAYYPRNRVVVVVSDDPGLLALCEELVPAHGLFLLSRAPGEPGSGLDALEALEALETLERRLRAQGWPAQGDAPDHGAGEYRAAGRRNETPPVSAAAGPGTTRAVGRSQRGSGTGDVSTGVMLVIVVVLEIVLGGGVIGLGASDPVLGFGFLLDACARVIGTVAASQSGDLDAAWVSVIIGSPALWGAGEDAGDAARVAQVTASVAGVALLLGLALAIL